MEKKKAILLNCMASITKYHATTALKKGATKLMKLFLFLSPAISAISVMANTETQARAPLACLPLVFVSRSPQQQGVAT